MDLNLHDLGIWWNLDAFKGRAQMLLTWTFTGLEPELRKNTLGVLRTLDSCRKVLIESIPPDWLRLAQIGSDGYQLAVNWAIDWSIVGTGLKAFLYYSPKIWSANLLILGTISVLVSWWPPNEQKISIVLEGLLKFIDVYCVDSQILNRQTLRNHWK